MTSKDIKLLISQWEADPKPPILRDPWKRRGDPSGEERAARGALRNRPDLGWALAQRLAGSGRTCPLLKRREYRWIQAAKNLHSGGVTATKHLRDVEVVEFARDLHESDEVRPVLNALLMTRDATAESVAEALHIKPVDVVEAYGDLFFNVLGRKQEMAFIRNLLWQGETASSFICHSSLPTHEENLLAAGFRGSIDDVLRLAGFATDSDDETEEELSSRLTRKMLKIGANFLDTPEALKKAPPAIVSQALDLLKKSKQEQPPTSDPDGLGDFVSSARGVLEKNKKVVEASIEHTNNPKSP